MAVDVSQVARVATEPGTLPETMTAWVIREERLGEPVDAFQLEEIETPQPGAFEVVVRVMAAGVNFNNVWAALGEPVSVMRYGDHPAVRPPHRRLRRVRDRLEGRRGRHALAARRRGRDPLQPGLLRGPRGARPRPARRALAADLGLRDDVGLVRAVHEGAGAAAAAEAETPAWEEAASYGLTYFTAYRMLMDQAKLQPGHRVLIWGAAGGLGVFATQLCKIAGAQSVGVVSSAEKGELIKQLGAVDYIDRNDFKGMMRKGGESPEEEKARFKESRRFCKAVEEKLGGPPDIVFEHVGRATFPTSVLCVRPFGRVVICGATSGYQLDFDVRYLWMRQKQIIGSHFANAWEATKANELIEQSLVRPVLWQTMGFEKVAEAHQLLRDNKHLGKIAILVGATEENQGKTADGPGAIRAEVGA